MSREKSFLYVFMVIFVLSIFLAGCGGGGGAPAGPGTKVSIITGVISDGPIKNARVFLDVNHNGIYDDGEPFSITNEKGEYRIEYILDSGTDYLVIVEGSPTLQTEDLKDNPADGSNLTFVMFVKMTSIGTRASEPVSAVYRQDVNPTTFKNYVQELDTNLGRIDEANIRNIIEITETDPTKIFKDTIKNKQVEWKAITQQVAEVVKSANEFKDLQSTTTDLKVASDAVMNLSEKNIADLSTTLAYQNKTMAKIGDMVVAKPLEEATTADVIITNMNPAEASQKMTLTVRPSTLGNYNVAITRYQNILDIPEFSQIRDNNYSVVLGGDITAKDSNGVKDSNRAIGASVVSGSAGFVDIEYLYFEGSLWVNGGQVNSSMTLKTVPFVFVKKNDVMGKTLNITGLSLLGKPVVVVKGYLAADVTKTVVPLDAVAVTEMSDILNVKIPKNFIISEVVVVDSELRQMTVENKASVMVTVADSLQTTTISTSIATGKTKFILNQYLISVLKDGNQEQDFPGLGSYIDTKMVYRGVDMYLGLSINSSVKQIINENINRYLDPAIVPTFYSGTGNFEGVTIDSVQKMIRVALSETVGGTKVADIVLIWSFDKNKVVRTYNKEYLAGDKKGSTYNSTYTFTYTYSAGVSLTNVIFLESISGMSRSTTGYTQNVWVAYDGTAVYERDSVDNSMKRLVSAKYDQKHSETNSLTKQTNTVDGLVAMEEVNATEGVGVLRFNGQYSLYVISYGVVSGQVAAANVTYAKGYNTQDGTYFNNNTLNAARVLFTSQSDYLDYPVMTNPLWIKGLWSGTFTDTCTTKNPDGQISLSVTDTTASWWGQSYDMSRNYGTSVEISGYTVILKHNELIWSAGSKISDTRLGGNWSYGGCQGSFVLNKT